MIVRTREGLQKDEEADLLEAWRARLTYRLPYRYWDYMQRKHGWTLKYDWASYPAELFRRHPSRG